MPRCFSLFFLLNAKKALNYPSDIPEIFSFASNIPYDNNLMDFWQSGGCGKWARDPGQSRSLVAFKLQVLSSRPASLSSIDRGRDLRVRTVRIGLASVDL